MKKEYTYYAFISYKREDEKWAKWLHKKLESYGFPAKLRKSNPSLPSKIEPVFRDKPELSGGNLKEEIENALSESKYLIVICSPRAAQSQWVSKEVQYFIDNGRSNSIIPFIIGGQPNANNPEEECFPEGLRQLSGEKEILGININEMGRDAAAVKVVARMFSIRFDTLWQRHERAKRCRNLIYIFIAILSILVAVSMFYLRNEAKQQTAIAQENQLKADEEKDNALALMAKGMISEDSYGACLIALNLLERNTENVQAEAVLRKAAYVNNITLRGHLFGITSLSFSQDGNYIATASLDSSVKLWNLNNGKCIKKLQFRGKEVVSVNYIPNTDMLIAITENGVIYHYNYKQCKFIKVFTISSNAVNSYISGNGKYIAVIDKYGKIHIYNTYESKVENLICTKVQSEDSDDIRLSFSYDGDEFFYIIERQNTIHKVHTISGEHIIKTLDQYNYTKAISLNNDGSQLLVSSFDGLLLFNSNLNIVCEVENESPEIVTFAYSNKQDIPISISKDGLMQIWNNDLSSHLKSLQLPDRNIRKIAFHPSLKYVAYCNALSDIGNVKILDLFFLESGQYYIYNIINQYEHYIYSMDMNILNNNMYLVVADRQCLYFHKQERNKKMQFLAKDSVSVFNRSKIIISPSGKFLAASNYNKIKIWDLTKGKYLKEFKAHTDSILEFDYIDGYPNVLYTITPTNVKIWKLSYNDTIIPLFNYDLSKSHIYKTTPVCLDNKLNLYYPNWSLDSIHCVNLLTGIRKHIDFATGRGEIIDLNVSPMGNYIAVSEFSNKLSVYDIISNKLISTMSAGSSITTKYQWHPSEKYIIASENTNSITIWDIRSAVPVVSIPINIDQIKFSRDGQYCYGYRNESHLVMTLPFIETNLLRKLVFDRFNKSI